MIVNEAFLRISFRTRVNGARCRVDCNAYERLTDESLVNNPTNRGFCKHTKNEWKRLAFIVRFEKVKFKESKAGSE